MLDTKLRGPWERWVEPLGHRLKRSGISADMVTGFGLVMAVACAVAIGSGHLMAGFVLMIATAIPDTIDGAVAKASGSASERGAFFDSVSDRVSDALVFGGVAWYYADSAHPKYSVLAFAVFASAALPSYIRAKADALGLEAKDGFVARGERFILLGVGLVFISLMPWVLAIMGVFNLLTSLQRFANVWSQAVGPRRTKPARSSRYRDRIATSSPAAQRWRQRRDAARERSSARRGL